MSQNHDTVTQGDALTPERFARVRAIFEAAIERPVAERVAYAAGACGGDAGLLREVEQMLVAEAETGMLPRERSGTSSAPEEGRFAAGSMLAERYRILGLLGRGGMGEVYRAYDTKLAQTVALKFLPLAVAGNARALDRFRSEVRIARQVSHRNVCRVYDLGEADGMPFLSMEYIDGEDLRALLRRIGRLPGDKAIEIARKLCAGLAAAHEKGVLHRDLKPANIMVDSQGQVMITDFGLAAAADAIAGGDIRSGTPAYMAPEQKEGREVTVRSDLYSLGLVFAEMFTGQGASRDGTLTATVKDLDPAVERAIERCLDLNPSRRPESALALARLLPGGDPLAEALAAGDTPTPAMVAASAEQGVLSVRAAVGFLVLLAITLIAAPFIGRNSALPLPDPTEVMQRKAQAVMATLGLSLPGGDAAFAYVTDQPYVAWRAGIDSAQRRALDGAARPSSVHFWYRQGKAPMPTADMLLLRPDLPPDGLPLRDGDAELRIDPLGRLVYLFAAPQPEQPPQPLDWTALLVAAQFEPDDWTPVEPKDKPATAFDARAAWTGSFPHLPGVAIRLEAAAWQGHFVYFRIDGPGGPPQPRRRTRLELS